MEGNEATIGVTAIALVVALILAWLLLQRKRSKLLVERHDEPGEKIFEQLIDQLDKPPTRTNGPPTKLAEKNTARDTSAPYECD